MTVSSQVSSVSYLGDGVTTLLPVPYYFLEQTHLLVTRVNLDASTSTLILGSDYSVAGAGNQAGGSITMFVAPAIGVQIIIDRAVPATQETDYVPNDPFPAESHERALDKLTMLIQQANAGLGRALLRPVGKNYFDAEGRIISNVQDPNQPQDAATKAFVQQEIADLLEIGSGSANNAANVLYVPNPSGQIVRTTQDRLRDKYSVRDYIDTAINGTTINQAGIVAAVAAAYFADADLEWPRGVYVSDDDIPYFHLVRHVGPGVLKRGSRTWVISGKSGDNIVYVGPGADTNDGLTPDNSIATVQAALDIFKAPYMDSFLAGGGTFRIQFSAGTWNDGGSFTGHLVTRNPVYIQGTLSGDGNTPATIIDGTLSLETAGIYMDGGPSNLYVRDIMSQNFRSNSVASGFVFANKGIARVFCDNLYTFNNLWAGVNVDSIGQVNMIGGIHDANTNYQFRVRGGVAVSVGRPGERRTVLKNSVGASVQVRDGSTGHFDYVDIINHPTNPVGTGVWVTNCSRLTFTSLTLTNCNLGILCGITSTFSSSGTVFTNVNTRFRCEGNGAQDDDSDAGLIGGQGWKYDFFQDRYSLGENVAPVAAFSNSVFAQFTKKTGTADWAYLVPASTIAREVFGNPTSNTFFRRDYDFANSRLQDVIQGTIRFRVTATDVNPVQDNVSSCGIAAARWSVVYAATATINTSDERYKQDIKPIDDACLRAWGNVEYVQYKFKDAVEAKADGARWHFGLIAQRVQKAFEDEGLDAFEYGLLCYDEWDETPATYKTRQIGNVLCIATGEIVAEDVEETTMEPGYEWRCTQEFQEVEEPAKPAGNRYGIRYEEALALECAYLRSKIAP